MTYVEKMATNFIQNCHWPEECHLEPFGEDTEKLINQIIADTKRADYKAVEETYSKFATPYLYDFYTAIKLAEVKAEGNRWN